MKKIEKIDITKLKPTGAKAATAKSDNLNFTGVEASQKMVETDLKALEKLKGLFDAVAKATCKRVNYM